MVNKIVNYLLMVKSIKWKLYHSGCRRAWVCEYFMSINVHLHSPPHASCMYIVKYGYISKQFPGCCSDWYEKFQRLTSFLLFNNYRQCSGTDALHFHSRLDSIRWMNSIIYILMIRKWYYPGCAVVLRKFCREYCV